MNSLDLGLQRLLAQNRTDVFCLIAFFELPPSRLSGTDPNAATQLGKHQ